MRAMLNKNLKAILFLSAFLLGWLWSLGAASAADYGLKVSSSITVEQDGEASIKQIFDVAGADKNNLPGQARINIVGREPAGLSAAAGGNKLTTQYDADSNSVFVTIPENRRDSTRAWSFSLNYRTQLLNRYGAVQAVQVPGMDTNLEVTSQITTFAADLDLGFATVRSRQPSDTGIGVGQQILTFKISGPEKSLLVMFGEQSFVTATFSTELDNKSWWWKEVGVTLPPDTNQQRVIIESIQPEPSKVRLDKDGNIVAFYNLAPLGSRQIDITAKLAIDNPAYELSSAVAVSETDGVLAERYTELTDVWQPLNLDLDLADDATSADVAKAVFNSVVARAEEQMINQEIFDLALRTSSLKMSDWLVGELRNRGIPAREVLGLSMSNGDRLSDTGSSHAWVEAYLAGVGWVTMDPHFGVYNGQYGMADSLRIGLALWGLEDDRPPTDLGLASIEFNDEAPEHMESYEQLSVSAKKYMVLPFISVFNQSVELGPGGVVDNVTLANQREELVLGSLAPHQKTTQRTLLIGASSFNEENVKSQIGNDEESVAETTSTTSYVALYIEAGLVLAWLMWRWIRKRMKRPGRQPKSRIKRSKEALTLHDEATGGSIENENLVTRPDILPQPVEPQSQPADNLGPKPPGLIQ